MPLLGQASGGFKESSSALRLLNVAIRNSIGVLTDDAFTQANPPAVTTAGTVTNQVDTTLSGVLSGSVCFSRPDAGSSSEFVGGPGDNTIQTSIRGSADEALGYRPLGLFINSANGNAFENTPAVASGVCPFVCGGGTVGNGLYETQLLAANTVAAGADLTYVVGMNLVSSRNGYLMPQEIEAAGVRYHVDLVSTVSAEAFTRLNLAGVSSEANLLTAMSRGGLSTVIGVLRMAPDSTQNELVLDLRV